MSLHKLKEILSIKYYSWLPKSVREFISPVICPTFLSIKRTLLIISQTRSSITLLQGKGKGGGNSLTTLFLGEEQIIPYFTGLLYSEEPTKKRLGKIFIWEIKSKLNLNTPKADLIFIGVDRLFSKLLTRQGFIILPEWVLFTLNPSKQLPENRKLTRNKSLRGDIRRIKTHKYSYEISHDPAKFEYFYHHMYLPYISKRFGETTLLTNFHQMKRIFEKGHLLLIKQKNEYLTGSVNLIQDESIFPHYIGIKEGKTEYLKQGALAASYYFTITWAKERGYKLIDFGQCRPFFNDGVFCYKKKWSMEIESKKSKRMKAIYGIKICNLNQGARDFLARNPFIFIDQDKLKGLILTEQNHPLTLGEIQSILKTHYIPGVDCLLVISPKGFTQQAEEYATSQPTQRLHLISMDPDIFFKEFPHILSPGKGLKKQKNIKYNTQ